MLVLLDIEPGQDVDIEVALHLPSDRSVDDVPIADGEADVAAYFVLLKIGGLFAPPCPGAG